MNDFIAHILVVDDDDGIRSLVKQYLNENNFIPFWKNLSVPFFKLILLSMFSLLSILMWEDWNCL